MTPIELTLYTDKQLILISSSDVVDKINKQVEAGLDLLRGRSTLVHGPSSGKEGMERSMIWERLKTRRAPCVGVTYSVLYWGRSARPMVGEGLDLPALTITEERKQWSKKPWSVMPCWGAGYFTTKPIKTIWPPRLAQSSADSQKETYQLASTMIALKVIADTLPLSF